MSSVHAHPTIDGAIYRWDRMGSLPRKGWDLEYVEDLGEPDHQCEACGYPEVRYVHHLAHHGVAADLAVGCVCAGHLTEDYETHAAAERKLRNRTARLRRLLDLKRWKTTRRGNLVIRYRGSRLVLFASHYTDGWRINVGDKLGRIDHPDAATAIRAAFRYLDPPVVRTWDQEPD
jgi:hypothetical protein